METSRIRRFTTNTRCYAGIEIQYIPLALNSGMADVLLSGIETILKDPSFSTFSPVAAGVLTSMKLLKAWCIHKENNAIVTHLLKNY